MMNCHTIFSLLVCYLASTGGTDAQRNADKDCPGPLKFYRELRCTPAYASRTAKCPIRFNCRSIQRRLPNKCYLGGREYNLGQAPAADDSDSCDHCTCARGDGEAYSTFICAVVDCFFPNPRPGCYHRRNGTSCCPDFEAVCPRNDRDIPRCTVDGKVYKDSEFFVPAREPTKRCFCGPRYAGNNVAPFCAARPRSECRTELHQGAEVAQRCAPVWEANESPQTSCPSGFRCQAASDSVLRVGGSRPTNVKCRFGNLTMNHGDELSLGNDVYSTCVKCRCEVPPTPTCQRLPSDQCQR